MTKRPTSPPGDAILVTGPWPHSRISIVSDVQALIRFLHGAGRPVCYLCNGYGLQKYLSPDAVCLVEFPPDQTWSWRRAFCSKRVYPSLTDLLLQEMDRPDSLLSRAGLIHSQRDRLIIDSDHPENSKYSETTIADAIAAWTGRRPLLVRTRRDDLQGNLDGFMRQTGIDYVALDRAGRESLLRGEVDLRPVVSRHVRDNRDRMRSWGWSDAFIDNAIDHAYWRLHQLFRWRYEVEHFDAVVCLTAPEVDQTRDLLLCEHAQNLTWAHNGISFEPNSRGRVDRLLHDYHHGQGLRCYRGAGADLERIAFRREDRKVVFVGRAVRQKGIVELAESLRRLYHSGRRGVRGIFVGGFHRGLRRALAGTDPTHAGEYLLFTGEVHDIDVLAALYSFGDVTAIPSHFEPFALVGLESYRMGTPCVVTQGTGAAEAYLDHPRRHGVEMGLAVRRRHAGGIVRYYGVDVESLAEQLAFLIDHPLVARRYADDGRGFVREHYSTERMGRTYLKLYDHLLSGGRASEYHART